MTRRPVTPMADARPQGRSTRSPRSGRRGSNTPAPETRRCAIYTRKSTSVGLDQEFSSLDAQREACEKYVASQAPLGWRLVDARYDDGGFTGSNLERPGFRRLLADVDAGKIHVVVVYKVDRLSRSLLDFARVMDRFNQAGVAFVSVTQNFSTADAMGRLTLNMLMSFAEFEREMIAERTRDKIAAARRRGKWTGGPVPIGYDVANKRLVVNRREAVVVRELFALYEQHRSALTVAKILDERGRTTKRHRAADGHVRRGGRWSKDAVLRVLRNPVHAGYMPCGDELHEGEHEAIVDRDAYSRVQAMLDDRAGRGERSWRNPAYLLRGLLRCVQCGGALTPASTRKRGGDHEYRYYRCVTRDKRGRKACPARPLPADAIETFVVDRIREATAGGDLSREIAERLDARVAARRQALETERRELPELIAGLSDEAATLAGTLGKLTGAAAGPVAERLEEVGAELGRQRARLQQAEQALAALARAEVEARWILDALASFDAVWDAMTVHNRGRLVRAVVHRVDVDDRDGTVTAVLSDLAVEPERASSEVSS